MTSSSSKGNHLQYKIGKFCLQAPQDFYCHKARTASCLDFSCCQLDLFPPPYMLRSTDSFKEINKYHIFLTKSSNSFCPKSFCPGSFFCNPIQLPLIAKNKFASCFFVTEFPIVIYVYTYCKLNTGPVVKESDYIPWECAVWVSYFLLS